MCYIFLKITEQLFQITTKSKMITYFNPCLHCSSNNNNKHITCNAAELNINISKNNIAFFPMQEEFENFKLFMDLNNFNSSYNKKASKL